MASQKNVLGFVDLRRKEGRAPAVGVRSFHETTMGLADLGRAGAGLKTKHLVGLLLVHGARARRASLPRTRIGLSCFAPSGEPAVKIRVE